MKVGEIVEITLEPRSPEISFLNESPRGLILREPNKVGMVLVLLTTGKEHYCHISNLKVVPKRYLVDV